MQKESIHLIGLHYSPWSEKAKWALDYNKTPYHYSEHLLIFGMPVLRFQLKNFFGPITVPALVDSSNGKAMMDSYEIAKYTSSDVLFPKEHLEKIKLINTYCEEVLDSGRALLTDKILHDPNAQEGFLPPFIPTFLKKFLKFLARIGVYYIQQGFGSRTKSIEEHRKRMADSLQKIQKLITEKDPVFEKFNFAHIAAACSLQLVDPPKPPYLKIDPRVRKVMEEPLIAKQFQGLIAWRDELYREQRLK